MGGRSVSEYLVIVDYNGFSMDLRGMILTTVRVVLREIEKEGPFIESKADKRGARRARKAEENSSGSAEAETNALPESAVEGQDRKESRGNQAADSKENTSKKPRRRLGFY